MDKSVVGLNITYGEPGYITTRSADTFRIEAGGSFVKMLTDPLMTVDGTVGERQRAHLHELLDEWIDNALQEKNYD